jgi:FkbM family methyltransferase
MTFRMKIRAELHKRGIDLCRSSPNIVDFLTSRRIETVYDVGANVGQYGSMLRTYGYTGQIISFEPVDGPYRELSKTAASDSKWKVCNFALGNERGKSIINVSDDTVFSSILPQSAAAHSFDRRSCSTYQQEIEVLTFDEVFGASNERAFLKVDTQGFEKQVLAGSANSLDRILGVQMELPVLHLYEGVWDMTTAIRFMADRGFMIGLLEPVNFNPNDRCSLVEVDCVFRRS